MLYRLLLSVPMMICFFWGIFFFIRCFRSENERRVTVCLVLFYTAATVLYADHWLYFSEVRNIAGEWSYGIVNLCVYPLYYVYLRALTRVKNNYEVTLLLLPALTIGILFPIHQFGGVLSDGALFLFTRLCFAIQVIWVVVRGYRLLLHTIRRMDNTYSDDRSRILQPTKSLLILFAATAVVSMILNIIGRDFFAQETIVSIPAVIMSILLYGLGFIASHTTIPPETVLEEPSPYEIHSAEDTDELMQRIDEVVQEKMLFKNPNLTIQDLATAVKSNRTYVSNCINRTYEISFSQYIAKCRADYARTILRDHKYQTNHEAIIDAVELSGFSSEQNFYRVFKEVYGITPVQYRKANR